MWSRETRLASNAIITSVLTSLPTVVRAEVADVTLKKLVARSALIVVAKVSKIEDGSADIRPVEDRSPSVKVATAQVVATGKWANIREVRFVASPTRYCDIASASEGERLVFFLEKRDDSTIMMIADVGRGGMPLREVEGMAYATLRSENVRLPKGTATIPGPDLRYSFIRSVELSTLKELVRENSRWGMTRAIYS
jgi:hypothetical protein